MDSKKENDLFLTNLEKSESTYNVEQNNQNKSYFKNKYIFGGLVMILSVSIVIGIAIVFSMETDSDFEFDNENIDYDEIKIEADQSEKFHGAVARSGIFNSVKNGVFDVYDDQASCEGSAIFKKGNGNDIRYVKRD